MCQSIVCLLVVAGLTLFSHSRMEAGVMYASSLEELTEELNRLIDNGSLQDLEQKVEELERQESEVPINAPVEWRDLRWPIQEKVRALTTLGRYAAALGQREKAEKHHLKALAAARRALEFPSTTSDAGFVEVLEAYVDFLLDAPEGLSPPQLFSKVSAEIEDVKIPVEARNVLVKRSDAIYALLPRFDMSSSGEGRCTPTAGVTRSLLVGNAHYREHKFKLSKGPINDVQILKRSLEERGVTAITVLNDADRTRMISEMLQLVRETRCGDFVVFHFSGHSGPSRVGSLTPPTGFESGLAPTDEESSGSKSISNAELSQFLTALRNRGASVVFYLDAGAHAVAIEVLQKHAATLSQWSVQLERTRLLEQQTDRGLARVSPNAGDYAVFSAIGMGFETKFLDSSGRSMDHGVLSHGLARVLQTQEEPTIRDVAKGLAKEVATPVDVPASAVRFPNATFVATASNPELVFLKPTRPINSETLPIEIISPKLQEVRGAITIQQPSFELIGRVENSAAIAQFMLDYKPIQVDRNGQFKVQIELSPGQNRVVFSSFRHDMRFQTRTLEFTYEGDLARFAAVGEKYALIIGIETYDFSAAWKPLKTPRTDALAIAEQLRRAYGFRVDLQLSNGQNHSLVLLDPGLQDITSTLTLLRQRLTENDSLLIYYAGHGHRLEDNKVAYWIPKDGKPDDAFTWLSASQLVSELKRMNARSVLIVRIPTQAGH